MIKALRVAASFLLIPVSAVALILGAVAAAAGELVGLAIFVGGFFVLALSRLLWDPSAPRA